MNSHPISWKCNIQRWSVWEAHAMNAAGINPDLTFVEPILRRRLSPLARAALHVAAKCAGDTPSVRMVYCSRHGDLKRTVDLLEQFSRREALSPANFGLSVLNAPAGIFSIARKDRAATTAIAAGEESFAWGLLDASSRVTLDPGPPVLYVYADAPVPEALGSSNLDVDHVVAIALLLGGEVGQTLTSECISGGVVGAVSQAEAFVTCLNVTGRASWSSLSRTWNWRLT